MNYDRLTIRGCCEPYREQIELGLSRGRNAMAIWQELVSLRDELFTGARFN